MKIYILLLLCTFWVTISLNAQCIDNGNYWDKSWTSCQSSPNPNTIRGNSYWAMFEFHENQGIAGSYVWNANRTGESGWGAKDVIIDYSTDGTTWVQLGTYVFPQATESMTYMGFQGPDFGSISVKKILVTILTTYDGTGCASLAEMRFETDSDVCTGVVDACGVCDGSGEMTWYIDIDGDGLGDATDVIMDCNQPIGYVANDHDECDNGALGWGEVATLFNNSGCTGCHGGASGLNLESYAGITAAGNKCGTNILTGTTLIDIITIPDYDACGSIISAPPMNDRVSTPLTDDELDKIQAWIDGGAPEACTDYVFQDINVSLRVFLEGGYQSGQGTMRTDLVNDGLLPTQQPYNVAPYNYVGTETITTFTPQMVDWVLVDIRTGADPSTTIASQAGILMEDGYIKSPNGSDLRFGLTQIGNYYIVVRHRNHLDIMTASTINHATNINYDFTNDVLQSYGALQLKTMADGKVAMHAGDITQDHVIQITDYDEWKAQPAVLNAYHLSDLNLDGVVQLTDYDLWFPNRTKIAPSELGY